ncbi:MAG: hypothetical protein AAGI23_15230 [Bacteroidota bacterium]
MKILHRESGDLHEAHISLIEDEDWEIIKQSDQFKFKWIQEKERVVYKIQLTVEDDILGLISTEDIPREYRIHIHLVENSDANKGKNKTYDFIAGALIAYTCQLAFDKDYDGFVSLEPKTALISLYKEKYGFQEMGNFLYTQLENSEALIKKYLSDEE